MANKDTEKHNILLGALIGGLIGGAAFFLLKTAHKDKSTLSKLGETLSEMGEIMNDEKDEKEAIEQIEKAVPKSENIIHSTLNWIATGLSLWQKIKKGS